MLQINDLQCRAAFQIQRLHVVSKSNEFLKVCIAGEIKIRKCTMEALEDLKIVTSVYVQIRQISIVIHSQFFQLGHTAYIQFCKFHVRGLEMPQLRAGLYIQLRYRVVITTEFFKVHIRRDIQYSQCVISAIQFLEERVIGHVEFCQSCTKEPQLSQIRILRQIDRT